MADKKEETKKIEEEKQEQQPEKKKPEPEPEEEKPEPKPEVKKSKEEKPMGSLKASIKAHILQTTIHALDHLANEALFQVKPQGIKVELVDNAHVAMATMEISPKAFEEYKATSLEIGVDLTKFNEILKLARSDDVVNIEFNCEGKGENCMYIQVRNIIRRIGCLDCAGMQKPKVPTLQTNAEATIEAGALMLGIKAAAQITDHLRLTMNKKAMEVYNEMDADFTKIPYDNSDGGPLLEINAPQKTVAMYSIDYLTNILKIAKNDTPIRLAISNDSPIKINYEFADGNGNLEYLIAPRIESE